MLQTLYVGNLYGTRIYIHWTFWILTLFVFLSNIHHGLSTAVSIVGFVFAVFVCVLLHEMGHAVAARAFGRATRDITLLPIGGVARIEGGNSDAWADGWIAAAGPAVNFAIAIALLFGTWITSIPGLPTSGTLAEMNPAQLLIMANAFLGISNLLPIFPLDGGLVLRSILCYWLDRPEAYSLAARVGQWIAGILILLSIVWWNFGGILFGVILLLVNTFQRLQSKVMVFQRDVRSAGATTDGPFSNGPIFDGPFGNGSWNEEGPGSRHHRGDTIDAIEVRELPPNASTKPNRNRIEP